MNGNPERSAPRSRRIAWTLIAAACLAWGAAAQTEAIFARVGEATISRQEYEQAVAAAARGKFYHGKTPEAEIVKLRREVGDRLVDTTLLVKEAQRRKIAPDDAAVHKTLDGFDARYKTSPEWQRDRANVLPRLKRKLEDDSLVARLEAAVRNVPEPSAKDVDAYYAAHPEKFTEPEQVKLSLILLKVDPSSPTSVWTAARDEGAAIVKRLRGGADFGALAQLHSSDPSAQKGGAMGYVHRGMLPEAAQEALDKMSPVSVSEPVVLLEGVAVMRLEDRKPARLNPLASVGDRARDLLRREQSDAAWTNLIAQLRDRVPLSIDTSVYAATSADVAGTGEPPAR